ncbi:hypothetical protein F5887DRAFT_1074130 [Amanita rubescens]|nr:hypothetical protein F5887DRAFT_1074130 [Amanita rubescens]
MSEIYCNTFNGDITADTVESGVFHKLAMKFTFKKKKVFYSLFVGPHPPAESIGSVGDIAVQTPFQELVMALAERDNVRVIPGNKHDDHMIYYKTCESKWRSIDEDRKNGRRCNVSVPAMLEPILKHLRNITATSAWIHDLGSLAPSSETRNPFGYTSSSPPHFASMFRESTSATELGRAPFGAAELAGRIASRRLHPKSASLALFQLEPTARSSFDRTQLRSFLFTYGPGGLILLDGPIGSFPTRIHLLVTAKRAVSAFHPADMHNTAATCHWPSSALVYQPCIAPNACALLLDVYNRPQPYRSLSDPISHHRSPSARIALQHMSASCTTSASHPAA